MGAGHSHRHAAGAASVPLERLPVRILVTTLIIAALATVAGAIAWWPDRTAAEELRGTLTYSVEGTQYVEGEIVEIQPRCVSLSENNPDCGHIIATPTEGPEKGLEQKVGVDPAITNAGLDVGEKIILMRLPGEEPTAEFEGQPSSYLWYEVKRSTSLWLWGIIFVVGVIAVARLRGLLALVSLGIAGSVIAWFLLPGLLTGEPAVWVSLVAASAIMFVVLYLTHGVSIRTSAALAGTLAGIGLSALAAHLAVGTTNLNGVVDEGGAMISTLLVDVSMHEVLKAAAIIAALGALNDITITQASSVWELREASPNMPRRQLYRSGMRIGRDHIASTIYTLAFAYVGSALTLLMAIGLYDRSFFALLGAEEIAQEIIHTVVGGLGILLAMPVTTALSVLLVSKGDKPGLGVGEPEPHKH